MPSMNACGFLIHSQYIFDSNNPSTNTNHAYSSLKMGFYGNSKITNNLFLVKSSLSWHLIPDIIRAIHTRYLFILYSFL